MSRALRQTNLPHKELRNIDELLGDGKESNLEAMNGTDIPFDDCFQLAGDNTNSDKLTVPFSVGQQEQDYPIIEFNAIEDILKKHSDEAQAVSRTIIQGSFPSVHHSQIGTLVNLIQTPFRPEFRVLVLLLLGLEGEMLWSRGVSQLK